MKTVADMYLLVLIFVVVRTIVLIVSYLKSINRVEEINNQLEKNGEDPKLYLYMILDPDLTTWFKHILQVWKWRPRDFFPGLYSGE